MNDRQYLDLSGVKAVIKGFFGWVNSEDSEFKGTSEKAKDSEKLGGHTSDHFAVDSTIKGLISAEAQARENADSALDTKIEAETTRATGEEQRIEGKLDDMFTHSGSDEDGTAYTISNHDLVGSNDVKANGSVVGIHGVSAGGISDPTSEGGGGATYNVVKSSDIDGVNTEYTDTIPTAYALNVVKKMVTKEVTDRNTAISEAVSSEESARESEISRVEGLVSDESTARSSADATLQTNISAEATARSTADTTLQTNINSEASARSTADSTLQTNINNEATARSTADTTLQANIDTEAEARASADTAINTSLDKVEDNVGTSVAIYDAESKRFVLSGVSLNPRSLTNCRYVFKMDKAVTELPESRSSAILSIGGFVNGIKWRGKNATPSNTWEEGAWVDAWYYDGSWYMTYANTRVSYEIWGEETIIVKPTN